MTDMIHILDADDKALLDRHSEWDCDRAGGPVGEIFADADCSRLVDNWREIARGDLGE